MCRTHCHHWAKCKFFQLLWSLLHTQLSCQQQHLHESKHSKLGFIIICIVYAPIVCPCLLCGNSRIAVQNSPVSVSKISILLSFPPTINIALFSVVPDAVVGVGVVVLTKEGQWLEISIEEKLIAWNPLAWERCPTGSQLSVSGENCIMSVTYLEPSIPPRILHCKENGKWWKIQCTWNEYFVVHTDPPHSWPPKWQCSRHFPLCASMN